MCNLFFVLIIIVIIILLFLLKILSYQIVSFNITEYIESLPLTNTPEVFGLHPNAEIGYYTKSARDMWEQLIELQPQSGQIDFLVKIKKYF